MTPDPARLALPVALLLPPLAWMTFEVGLASTLRPACESATWLGPVWGGAAVFACLLALLAAGRAIRDRDGQGGATGRWMARLAMLGTGIFTLAILFQTLATLIVPSCVR